MRIIFCLKLLFPIEKVYPVAAKKIILFKVLKPGKYYQYNTQRFRIVNIVASLAFSYIPISFYNIKSI